MSTSSARASVLQLVTRMNVGGPARHVLAVAHHLDVDWDIRVAAGAPAPHEGDLTDPDVQIARLPLVRQVRPHRDLAGLVATRQLLASTRPTILHTHMAKAGAIGRVAARSVRPRPRTVHTFHGHVLDGYFGPVAERSFLAAERSLARRTDLLVAVSSQVRDQLLELGIGRPEQYRVVPIGVDLTAYDTAFEREDEPALGSGKPVHADAPRGPAGALRSHLGVSADVPLIGVLARLEPVKDHLTLLRALVEVPEAHLVLLGDGALRSQLTAEAEKLGLRDRVHLPGWWRDVPGALADVDVVALSSVNEGTPVCLIEAGMASVPVVATEVGGVSSVVADGRTGLLCPPHHPAALAAALRRVLEDPQLAADLGAAASRHVAAEFDRDRALGALAAVYAELLEG